MHPSFEVTWHDKLWKVKFGEERSSGPFGCRIFWALGYPTDILDYTPEIKVSWDRRILTKFNSRQLNGMKVSLLGLPIGTQRLNPYFDPFDYIQYAVLKDGAKVSSPELRAALFHVTDGEPVPKHPEKNKSLFDKKFESRIDYLVMKAASVVSKEKDDSAQVGNWDFNGQDHPKLREVRAMGLLDAWLDNWDVRWGNTRLYLESRDDGTYRLEHKVSDLGALFGNSAGMLRQVHGRWKQGPYQNVPNDYTWSFTHHQAAGKTTVPISNYMPASKIRPFYEMNIDDARWMARRIAQLTETQIKSALIAAGYDAATARLLLEKLVSRRDKMIKDLGLDGEIAILRPQGVNKHISYNPAVDGPFEVSVASGAKCRSPYSGEFVVANGNLHRPTGVKQAGLLSAGAGP